MNADDLLVEADALQQRGDPLGELFALTAAFARDRADRGALSAEIRLLSMHPGLHAYANLARIREARRTLLGHACWQYEYRHLVRATGVGAGAQLSNPVTLVALGVLVFPPRDAIAFSGLISGDVAPSRWRWADEAEPDDRPDPRDHLILGHAHWQTLPIDVTADRLEWKLVVDVYVRPTPALVARGVADPALLAALRDTLGTLTIGPPAESLQVSRHYAEEIVVWRPH